MNTPKELDPYFQMPFDQRLKQEESARLWSRQMVDVLTEAEAEGIVVVHDEILVQSEEQAEELMRIMKKRGMSFNMSSIQLPESHRVRWRDYMCTKQLSEMSKDERSLLIYLETCAVDYRCRLEAQRMNEIDMDILKRWNEEKFISFGRLKMAEIEANNTTMKWTHFALLSPEAWELAHAERRARAKRMLFADSYGGKDLERYKNTGRVD